jgi:hypothetical protein
MPLLVGFTAKRAAAMAEKVSGHLAVATERGIQNPIARATDEPNPPPNSTEK